MKKSPNLKRTVNIHQLLLKKTVFWRGWAQLKINRCPDPLRLKQKRASKIKKINSTLSYANFINHSWLPIQFRIWVI